MTITTKDVTRRGNAVGYDASGNIVTVEPRSRVLGKPTPWAVARWRNAGALNIPVDRETFDTKEAACQKASELTVRPIDW